MLVEILGTLVVCVLAFALICAASARVCLRLGLHPLSVLLFFGIVERPLEVPRAKRRRLGEIVLDAVG